MNRVTVGAGALTKRTPHNSRQTKQTATNQQHATEQDTADKQTAERAHRDARTDTQVTHNSTSNPKQGAHAHENAPHARKPRNRTQQAQSRGIPTPHTQPTPPRPATTPPQGEHVPEPRAMH